MKQKVKDAIQTKRALGIQPKFYTSEEGGDWIDWAKWNRHKIHSIKFTDGSVFDVINGIRT